MKTINKIGKKPLISLVIPLFNKKDVVSTTINSCLNQTYQNIEIIIIDDGSTDGSGAVVKTYKDSRIRYYYKENGGVSSARNFGLWYVKGDYIMFLDADDIILSDCIEKLTYPLFKDSNIDLCCGKSCDTHSQLKSFSIKELRECYVEHKYKDLFYDRYSMRQGCYLIKEHIAKNIGFDNRYSKFEDIQTICEWLKIANVYHIPDVVSIYRKKYSNLSKQFNDPDKDYTFHMSFSNKAFWEKCIMGKLLYLGWLGYKDNRIKLISVYQFNMVWAVIARLLINIDRKVRS